MMRNAVVVALTLTILPAAAAGARENLETEHLVIVPVHDSVSDREMELAAAEGERFYAAIHELLGTEPATKVGIVLDGPAQRADGTWGYPRIDSWGRVLLYRFTDEPEGYLSALAHELVHVFRIPRWPHHDWFFEEGFAELVAIRVDPSRDGFPWYGYPVDLVAAQFLVRDEDLALATLRERHAEINIPCKLQSYSLRGAFFVWLAETYGDEKVLAMAAAEQAGSLADYERFLGKPFAELETEWRTALLASYRQRDDADRLAEEYRTKSPAQYQPVCSSDGTPGG